MNKNFTSTIGVIIILLLGTSGYPQLAAASHPTFADGDVFVSISDGKVNWYHPDGTLRTTCDTTLGSFTTGSAFDAADNLYVTNFGAGTVSKFDNTCTLIGIFGSGYSGFPESLVRDAVGEWHVGAVDGDNDVRHFTAAGTAVHQHDVPEESRGSDWVDLAADQTTLFYTSEGSNVLRYDLATDTSLANFNAALLPGSAAFALRIIPAGPFAGHVLVADSETIVRLDATGAAVATYDKTGEDSWFALNLDPDGTSFWSADFSTSDVVKFDIATGAELFSFNTGTTSFTVFGLSVNGEITAATEICGDGIDNNNNGQIDEGCPTTAVGGEVLPIDTVALLTLAIYSQPYWLVLLSLPVAVAFATIKFKNRK